jgi:hypothetical protein
MNEDKRDDVPLGNDQVARGERQIDLPGEDRSHGSRVEMSANLQGNHAELVLFLGIISLFMCGPLGIIAWVMGNSDLKKIRTGLMSPLKIGTLRVGKALGIIGTCLFAASFVIVGLIAHRGVADLSFKWKSSPLPPHQFVFVGEWSGKKGTVIRIHPSGRGDFKSHHSSLVGGNVRIDDNRTLSIGTMGLSKTWHIDKPPHLENSDWIMELDNEEFVRGGEGHLV